MYSPADFFDLPEFGAGHFTDPGAMTGCTAFVARGDCAGGATCAVDVRGGAPATRETDLLRPENMVQKANAVMIGGGSAFGLEAACGAMEALAARKIGFELAGAHVPIVPAACLFDLPVGKAAWPDKAAGAAACAAALDFDGAELAQGVVGAGTGATVGKMGMPEQASKSGFGWHGLRMGDVVVIGCVAVNALGNVLAEDGGWLAGVRDAEGGVMDPLAAAAQAMATGAASAGAEAEGGVKNTTLGVVLTNAKLSKAQATKVAQQAQDGYARAIKPVHTTSDGDAIFVMASGKVEVPPDMVGIMAADAIEAAIRSAVRHVSA